jgi:hypothetical protein
VSVTQGGSRSCQAFCGYHNATSADLYYGVMPYPGCSGCAGRLALLDALTTTSSHELCEAITDPVPGQGWYDDHYGEIGDICAWKTRQLGGQTGSSGRTSRRVRLMAAAVEHADLRAGKPRPTTTSPRSPPGGNVAQPAGLLAPKPPAHDQRDQHLLPVADRRRDSGHSHSTPKPAALLHSTCATGPSNHCSGFGTN